MESCGEEETGESGFPEHHSQWDRTEKAVLVGSDPHLTQSPFPPCPWRWSWLQPRARSPHTRASGSTVSCRRPSSPCPRSGSWTLGLGKHSAARGGASEALSEVVRDRLNANRSQVPGSRRAALGSWGTATGTTEKPTLLPQLSDLFWLRGQVRFLLCLSSLHPVTLSNSRPVTPKLNSSGAIYNKKATHPAFCKREICLLSFLNSQKETSWNRYS